MKQRSYWYDFLMAPGTAKQIVVGQSRLCDKARKIIALRRIREFKAKQDQFRTRRARRMLERLSRPSRRYSPEKVAIATSKAFDKKIDEYETSVPA